MTTLTHRKVKQSFTIESELLEKLSGYGNKSQVVNQALAIYFEKAAYLEKAEEDFWKEKVDLGLADVAAGRTTVINPNGEKITDEMLEKTLWL